MKISNEQLQALQQQTEAKAKPRPEGIFDAILSEKLGSAQKLGSSNPAPPVNPATGILGHSSVLGVQATPESTAFAMVAESINGMLASLDDYAETLATPQGADLRKAYGILQGMDKNLVALRENTPDLATQHAGMSSLVDEISVITRTETVKLNRGDYL